jgi:ryanodine receptor 2
MPEYKPKPVDTSDIELPEELNALVEMLSENAHEEWALGRVNEGWTFGEQRDDEKKLHPCLVAYGDLPDSEKEYDRKTAMSTVKLLVLLGWNITKTA